MLDRADAILKLALAAAALIVCSGVGYYYGLFLPQQAAAAAQQQAVDQREKAEASKAAADQKAKARQEAEDTYNACLSAAQIDYSNRWDNSCKTNHDRMLKLKSECLQTMSADFCQSYDVPPDHDCTLPNAVSDSYDASLQQSKQLCLDTFKEAQR